MRKINLLLTHLTIICLSSINPLVRADDAPQFRGRPATENRLRRTMDRYWIPSSELAWQAEGLGKGYASVSVVGSGSTLRQLGQGQTITALSTVDGKVVWSTPITDKDPSTLTMARGRHQQSMASVCTRSRPMARSFAWRQTRGNLFGNATSRIGTAR